MSVTYEQAREIIRDRLEPGWTHGTFCLDDRSIVENDEFFVFEVGTREFLVDGDGSYEAIGGVPLVYKEDGRVGPRSTPGGQPFTTGRLSTPSPSRSAKTWPSGR
jgi:hypothetical protein